MDRQQAYRRFVDIALTFQGHHYIWGGKGFSIFDPIKGLKPHMFKELNSSKYLEVFDCSGLVTICLHQVTKGKVDLRGSFSAKTMLDRFPFYIESNDYTQNGPDGLVYIYPGHVDIDLGRNRCIDANGGDETTTSIQAAIERNAKVSMHPRTRTNVLGIRRIPLDMSELRS